MHALKLLCLIALVPLIRCQSLMELSGNGRISIPPDDEDADAETYFETSGSGDDGYNTTVNVPPTVIVTSTSAERTTTKLITMPKVVKTTPKVKSSSKQQTTVDQRRVNEDEDEDDDTKQESRPTAEDDQSSTAVTTTSDNLDLMELLWKQPGIVAGLIGGAILGVLFAILLTLFIIYRMRRRSDRAFRKGTSRGSQDDTGTFWFDDEEAGTIAVSRTSAERYPRSTDAYVNPQVTTDTLKGSQVLSSGSGAQGQSGLYATLVAPSGQTAYDEYLANLYNQQVYNGYLQKA